MRKIACFRFQANEVAYFMDFSKFLKADSDSSSNSAQDVHTRFSVFVRICRENRARKIESPTTEETKYCK